MSNDDKLTKFNQAFSDYYKLKSQYDNKNQSEVSKITKNPNLTTKEKQEKFKQFKSKCVNCGKLGGTIFKQEGNLLSAKCGHVEKPCKLDIQLQKATYANMNNLISELNDIISINKKETITGKLDFLFGYANESTTLENFNKLKQELIDEVKKYQKINEIYLDLVYNVAKMKEIKFKKEKLLVIIKEFKDLIKNFEDTGDFGYLKNAVELYVNTIDETANNIRDLKYVYNTVEYNGIDDTHHLIQEQYTQAQLQIPINNTVNRIIAFKK
jgi:hypothetical protein